MKFEYQIHKSIHSLSLNFRIADMKKELLSRLKISTNQLPIFVESDFSLFINYLVNLK